MDLLLRAVLMQDGEYPPRLLRYPLLSVSLKRSHTKQRLLLLFFIHLWFDQLCYKIQLLIAVVEQNGILQATIISIRLSVSDL